MATARTSSRPGSSARRCRGASAGQPRHAVPGPEVRISAAPIVAISEIARRHSGFAALLASLPITSLLAFIWLRLEQRPSAESASLSLQIFWLVRPSLALFVLLALLLRHGWHFWLALVVSCAATVTIYLAALPLLRRFGVEL